MTTVATGPNGSVWIFASHPDEMHERSLIFEVVDTDVMLRDVLPFGIWEACSSTNGTVYCPDPNGTVAIFENERWKSRRISHRGWEPRGVLLEETPGETGLTVGTLDDVWTIREHQIDQIPLLGDSRGLSCLTRLDSRTLLGVNGSLWRIRGREVSEMLTPRDNIVATFVDDTSIWAIGRKQIYRSPGGGVWQPVQGARGDFAPVRPIEIGGDLYLGDWTSLGIIRSFRSNAHFERRDGFSAPSIFAVGDGIFVDGHDDDGDFWGFILQDTWVPIAIPRVRVGSRPAHVPWDDHLT